MGEDQDKGWGGQSSAHDDVVGRWSSPREDVLSVVVPQVDLGRSTERNALHLVLHDLHVVRVYMIPISNQLIRNDASPGLCAPAAQGTRHLPIVASIQTGCAPVNSAICFTSGK